MPPLPPIFAGPAYCWDELALFLTQHAPELRTPLAAIPPQSVDATCANSTRAWLRRWSERLVVTGQDPEPVRCLVGILDALEGDRGRRLPQDYAHAITKGKPRPVICMYLQLLSSNWTLDQGFRQPVLLALLFMARGIANNRPLGMLNSKQTLRWLRVQHELDLETFVLSPAHQLAATIPPGQPELARFLEAFVVLQRRLPDDYTGFIVRADQLRRVTAQRSHFTVDEQQEMFLDLLEALEGTLEARLPGPQLCTELEAMLERKLTEAEKRSDPWA